MENNRKYAGLLWATLFSMLLMPSCNDENEHNNSFSREIIELRVSPPKISENSENTEITKSGTEAPATLTVNAPTDNIAIEATLEGNAIATRGSTALATGVKYRVIAFKQGDVSAAGYINHADFVVGKTEIPSGFHVHPNITYTFICYSFNSTDSLPAFDKNALNIVANPDASDLLYTQFDKQITSTSKLLSFCFTRKYSQITVIADATNMAQNISTISATLSPNYSCTLSLNSGEMINANTYTACPIRWGTITPGQTLYSTPCRLFTNGSSTVTINIPSVTIGDITQTNLTATFNNKIIQIGNKYTLRLQFMRKRDLVIKNSKQEALQKSIELYGKMWDDKKIVVGELQMPFDYRVFGDKPADGRSLYISMHGGGGTTTDNNNQQWQNQITLYQPTEGVYLAPRAPWDAWNMWFKPEIDPFFEILIRTAVVKMDVNPNKVYLLGYSAGGDGVWRMAPRMADSWAASSMMAGHPGEASQVNLRNVPFMIWVGENDTDYQRNLRAKGKGIVMDQLQASDPAGYIHETHIVAGAGHWMNLVDAAALPWMAKYKRNPLPPKIVWQQEEVTRTSMYWLALDKEAVTIAQGMKVIASYQGNTISIDSCDYPALLIRLNDKMMNLDLPVTVKYKDMVLFAGIVPWNQNVAERTAERGDPDLVFCSELNINIPN